MKIQDVIANEKMFSLYKDRYIKQGLNPFFMYSNGIPENIFHKFLDNASYQDIGLYFFGLAKREYTDLPYCIASLEKHHGYKIPVIDGILTPEFWKQFEIEFQADITETRKLFNIKAV